MFCQTCGAADNGGVLCSKCGGKDFGSTRPEISPEAANVQSPRIQAQQIPQSNSSGSSCASTLGGIAALLFLIGMLFSFFGL